MRAPLSLVALTLVGCGASVTAGRPRDAATDAATDAVVTVDAPPAMDRPPSLDRPPTVDVPPAVDVPPTALPLGAACTADAQCASRLCSVTLGRRCVAPCAHDADCARLDPLLSCLVDRSPAGRAVCGQVPTAMQEAPGSCRSDADCYSNLCLDGLCRNLCAADTECAAGWRCGAVTASGGAVQACRADPITGPVTESFVLTESLLPVDRGTAELALVVPPDAVSITWGTQDLDGSNLFATVVRVTEPTGRVLVDLPTWNIVTDQVVRMVPNRFQIGTATQVTRDTERVAPGVYRSIHGLANDPRTTPVATRHLRAWARVKRAPGGVVSAGTLDLVVFPVGLSGVNAGTLNANPRWQQALASMQSIYRPVGLNVRVVGARDLSAADAARFSVIDTQQEYRELLTRSAGLTGDVLPLFLVRGISTSAGLEGAIGVAGAINGPPGVYGTLQSGVVVGWETTLGRRDLLAQTMAHECGHYLGLWHTVENVSERPPCTMSGQQDCSLFGGVDPISDTPTNASAASYLMHWVTNGTNSVLSAGQGRVMRGFPVVR